MDCTTAGNTAAGTTAVNSPNQKRSYEDRRPSISGHFPSNIQINGCYNHEKPTLQDALAQLSPDELAAVPSNTIAVEDFDALLASLESDDEEELSIEDKIPTVGEARPIPSILLETSPNRGLDDAELISRRKKYGWNVMKEESRSHIRTFLMFFVGPIQCVMLVSRGSYTSSRFRLRPNPLDTSPFLANMTCSWRLFWLRACRTGSIWESLPACSCSMQ